MTCKYSTSTSKWSKCFVELPMFSLRLLLLSCTHWGWMCTLYPHRTPPHIYTNTFYSFTSATRWAWRERATDAQNAAKYGETAGITCLTLQPVLALVSMNMTFSSLALCSPSSIMICLQENQARLWRWRLIYSALTSCFYQDVQLTKYLHVNINC